MEKTTSVPVKLWHFLPPALNFILYGSLLWIILSSELPPVKESVFVLRRLLFQGQETVFRVQDPGLGFILFKVYRPQEKCVSFLTDLPYDAHHKDSELLQAAQGELAPLLLNSSPSEKTAFFFCSNTSIAEARIKATGYKITQILGEGKVIAEKLP